MTSTANDGVNALVESFSRFTRRAGGREQRGPAPLPSQMTVALRETLFIPSVPTLLGGVNRARRRQPAF
ncbi:hypothetical protein FRAHR75_1540008 [Frankia sp. Hr75.2]|nr:hypothetical protein FRAHR75_1540008 [Frankia sp. Hr75.2]SQE00157.1 hypothetical protein FMEAI12_6190005 [Parafrankia sp. Ea1.12]